MNTICFGLTGGIGDALFATPTFHLIKQYYPDIQIQVVGRKPSMDILEFNPYINELFDVHKDISRKGFLIEYPNPIKHEKPVRHHIHTAWRQICGAGKFQLPLAPFQPEVYLPRSSKGVDVIGVQIYTKRSHIGDMEWRDKKRWPYALELARKPGYEPIKIYSSISEWVYGLSQYKLIVCNEGGVSHVAKALNIPTIVIFGGYSKPEWNGYLDQWNIRTAPKCQGCYDDLHCNFRCMTSISAEYVHNVAKEILHGQSPQ